MSDLLIPFVEWGFLGGIIAMGMLFHFFDEPLHRKRSLTEAEIQSHLMDSIAFVICFALALWARYDMRLFWLYFGSAVFAGLLTFKDELNHHENCTPQERLVHALMFTLNGIIFILAGLIILLHLPVLYIELALLGSLGTYIWQIYYWSLRER
ncbi:MAG: hypothetical protein SFT81_00620 [Candidatus Caenarcaniphilales bacterium]|nr:hypothetical protein [Candidatus Caenarcaniphilales bacterium]